MNSIHFNRSYKTHYFLLLDLLDEMSVNYQILIPSDGRYGGKSKETRRWNGMVGMAKSNVS